MERVFERAFLEPQELEAISVEINKRGLDDWFEAELTVVNRKQNISIYFSDYEPEGIAAFSKEQFEKTVNKLRILQNALALIEKHMVEYAKDRYPELLEQPVAQETDQEIEVTAEEEEYQQGLVQVDISDKMNEFPKL